MRYHHAGTMCLMDCDNLTSPHLKRTQFLRTLSTAKLVAHTIRYSFSFSPSPDECKLVNIIAS